MHRFARTAQHKNKDRWGGSFVLAAVLALVGAYALGTWLNQIWGGDKTAETDPFLNTGEGTSLVSTVPDTYNLYFVQVHSVRSQSKAETEAEKLSKANYSAAVTPRTATGYKVWVGPYTSKEAADAVLNALKSEEGFEQMIAESAPWVSTVRVNGGTVVPAMAGTNQDLAKAMDMVNSYLYEVANWFENRGLEGASISRVASIGQELDELVMSMDVTNDPAMTAMVAMANMAAFNAEAMQNASTALPSSEAYREALHGYLQLLHQYNNMSPLASAN